MFGVGLFAFLSVQFLCLAEVMKLSPERSKPTAALISALSHRLGCGKEQLLRERKREREEVKGSVLTFGAA